MTTEMNRLKPSPDWFEISDRNWAIYSPKFNGLSGGIAETWMETYQTGNAQTLGELGDARRLEYWQTRIPERTRNMLELAAAESGIHAVTGFTPARLEVARLRFETEHRIMNRQPKMFATGHHQFAFLEHFQIGSLYRGVARGAQVYMVNEVDASAVPVAQPQFNVTEAAINIVAKSPNEGGFGANIWRNGTSVEGTWGEFSGGFNMGPARPVLDNALGFQPAFATNLITNVAARIKHGYSQIPD